MSERRPPPWLFFFTGIPFGAAGAFVAVTVPFLLRQAGVPVGTIAAIAAAALIPSSYQFLWAPIIDIGPRRRTWLMLVSLLGALCLSASMFVDLKQNLLWFEILLVAGQGITGLVGSCNGGLMATTLAPEQRGFASGCLNAANLGGSAVGGGLILFLARSFSPQVAGLALGAVVFFPSLAALFVPEAPRARRAAREVFSTMGRGVWKTVRSRAGITGILICLSPVGTAAMLNLFSSLAEDYGASSLTVEIVNGYWGGLITAAGAFLTGLVLDRIDKRAAYLLGGVFLTITATGMALAPVTPYAYTVGSLAYLFVTGWCYAAFTAFVLDVIGKDGHWAASTQYTLFTAAGNQAIAYVTWFDGKGYVLFKARGLAPTAGMLFTDAAANLAGVMILGVVLFVVFRNRREPTVPSEEAPAAAA